jgi:hypothetical protein
MRFQDLEAWNYYRCSSIKGNSAIVRTFSSGDDKCVVGLLLDTDFGTVRFLTNDEEQSIHSGIFERIDEDKLQELKQQAMKRIENFFAF